MDNIEFNCEVVLFEGFGYYENKEYKDNDESVD